MSSPLAASGALTVHDFLMQDPYYEAPHRGRTLRTSNPLLVKPVTGKGKLSTYDLPPEGFTYGKPAQFVGDGVREAVNSWQNHVPNPNAAPGRDFVRLNKSAVMHGAITPKEVEQFRQTNDFRVKLEKHEKKGKELKLDPNFVFGKPSGSTQPMNEVLSNSYARDAIVQNARDLAYRSAQAQLNGEGAKRGKFAQSAHTKASLGHMKVPREQPKQPFKMKRFLHVGSKVAAHLAPQQALGEGDDDAAQYALASSQSAPAFAPAASSSSSSSSSSIATSHPLSAAPAPAPLSISS